MTCVLFWRFKYEIFLSAMFLRRLHVFSGGLPIKWLLANLHPLRLLGSSKNRLSERELTQDQIIELDSITTTLFDQAVDLGFALGCINFEIARSMDAPSFTGYMGLTLADLQRRSGQYKNALVTLEEARHGYQLVGQKQGEGVSIGNMGNVHAQLGQIQDAIACYKAAVSLAIEIDDYQNALYWLGNLGNVYSSQGDHLTAIPFYEQSLEIALRLTIMFRKVVDHATLVMNISR